MKKKIILSIGLLTTLFTNNLFAETANLVKLNTKKDIYIDMYSPAGKEILTSEKAYEQYLEQKYKFKEKQKQIISTVSQNCKNIELLKAAVAKIIIQLSKMEKENENNSLKNKQKIQQMLQEIKKLKKEISQIKKEKKVNLVKLQKKVEKIEKDNPQDFEEDIITVEKINKRRK